MSKKKTKIIKHRVRVFTGTSFPLWSSEERLSGTNNVRLLSSRDEPFLPGPPSPSYLRQVESVFRVKSPHFSLFFSLRTTSNTQDQHYIEVGFFLIQLQEKYYRVCRVIKVNTGCYVTREANRTSVKGEKIKFPVSRGNRVCGRHRGVTRLLYL